MELFDWLRKLNNGVFHVEPELKLMYLKEDEVLFVADQLIC